MKSTLKHNTKILFQGDSITDGGRCRNEDLNHVMGHGYAYLVAAKLGADYPERNLSFCNRGISGNCIVDLYERWKEDAINLSPDIISILVGVNGIYHGFASNKGVPASRYEKVYRLLLEETCEALPNARLVICEPFVLPVASVKERWSEWKAEIDQRRKIAACLADQFDAVFVGMQNVFEDARALADPEYWIWDGIHPMPAGHELMARAWLAAVKETGWL